MTFKITKNHIALTSCEDIAAIMLPSLSQHGITVFNYYRMYHEGSAIRFSTDRAWTEHFFRQGYLNKLNVPQAYLSNPVNYYIWLTEDCPEILLDAAINFNTSNGISIAKKHPEYIDYFCFATTSQNKAIINYFYLNHLDVLMGYCDYFKEQAKTLLRLGSINKLLINKPNSDHSIQHDTLIQQPVRHHSTLIKFSERQAECAVLLMEGISYKEIARKLNLSPRTIETHVFYLKRKLNCHNKTELVIRLAEVLK